MSENYKLCDFNKYCPLCKNRDTMSTDDPCNACLAQPANVNSEKPLLFKQDDSAKTGE